MFLLLAQFELANPGRLTALLVLPLLVLVAYRYARFDGWQRAASLTCRLAIFAMLVFALAGPYLSGRSNRRYVVVAVDQSASIGSAEREAAKKFVEQVRSAAGESKVAVLNFAAGPEQSAPHAPPEASRAESGGGDAESPPKGSANRRHAEREEYIGASDLGAAVLTAAASIPANYVPEVVLLSDGRQNRGDLLTSAERAGVPVAVVPLAAFSEPEVGIGSVSGPPLARPGTAISLHVVVDANGENSGRVEVINLATQQLLSQEIKTVAGPNPLAITVVTGSTKSTQYEVRLTGFNDKHPENNRTWAVVYNAPPTKALIVDVDAPRGERLAAILKGQEIDAAALAALPSANELAPYDVLVMSGPVPKSVSAEQATTLESFVRQRGGGLIVTGPAVTFGEAAYQATSFEKLLPVSALPKADERQASLALTLVIDRSASMLEDNRLGLAKDAARQAVELLTPQDKAGVVAFGSESEWISEIYPCSDKPELLRRIATLKPEGQTNMYPALVKAFLAMEQVDADRRHVILLTDGTPSPGDFQQIAARMAAAGITVSTVSISKGAEQSILKDISRAARGRHYHCDNPQDVPKILVQETKSAAATAASEFKPLVFRQLPGLDVGTAPPLSGAVAVSPKSRAELLLIGAEGDPLLSWWRYGEGVAVALAADVQQPWSNWPGYGPFWKRLVSHAARDSSPREFSLELRQANGRGIATLEALADDGKFLNGARGLIDLASTPGKKPEQLELTQIAPGRYRAEFSVAHSSIYEATATLYDPAEPTRELYRAARSLAADYPAEFRVRPANEPLLKEVARVSGGVFNPKPDELFASTDRSVPTRQPLGWFFVLAAALILVADVTVRRYHEWIGTPRSAERNLASRESHVGGANEAA